MNEPQADGKNETQLGIDPQNVHRVSELPSALRTDKLDRVPEEAIRSQQAQANVINPGRQKR